MFNTNDKLKIVEQNHLEHFMFLPKNLGFDVCIINQVSIINCGLNSSMFNIAYGAGEHISNIKKAFKGQSFAWWIPPSQHDYNLTQNLLKNDFILQTVEHAMMCDLININSLERKTDLIIKQVVDNALLQDFIILLEYYDKSVRSFYEKLLDQHLQLQEKLYIGYIDKRPVTTGILFCRNFWLNNKRRCSWIWIWN